MNLRPIALVLALAALPAVVTAQVVQFNKKPRNYSVQPIDPRVLQQNNNLTAGRAGEISCLITDVNHTVGTVVRFRCHQLQDGVQFIDLPVDRPGAALMVQALAGASVEGRTIRIAYEQSQVNARCNGGNACAVLVGTK